MIQVPADIKSATKEALEEWYRNRRSYIDEDMVFHSVAVNMRISAENEDRSYEEHPKLRLMCFMALRELEEEGLAERADVYTVGRDGETVMPTCYRPRQP